MISVSHIFSTYKLILLINSHQDISVTTAISICRNSGDMGGSVPVNEGLKLGLDYNILEIKKDRLFLTHEIDKQISDCIIDKEKNIPLIRLIIKNILLNENYIWLLYFDEDIELFQNFIPIEWANILGIADLFNFTDNSVLDWWKIVLNKFNDFNQSEKKKIGDVGEQLTIDYEIRRLKLDKFENPHLCVKWASRISDDLGFDIISKRGNLLELKKGRNETIQLEVKSSINDDIESFTFFVSRNQFNNASDNSSSYFFYCWPGIEVNTKIAKKGPFIVPFNNLQQLFPNDSSNVCEWHECRFTIDLNKYSIL